MDDKKLVVQHNKIVEAKYKLSLEEQRLVKFLVSLIEKDDEDFKPYKIAVADLANLIGLKRKDYYKAVKETTKSLISKVLVFEGYGRTIQAAWLSSADYYDGEGFVILQFAPVLKPFLLHLKGEFTKYELCNVIRLKHTYSIRLYELLKQYEKIGKRKFLIGELRNILMLEEDEYKQFCDFRKRVLKTAQDELLEKTDITFSWTEERKNKKCVSIEFIIESKHSKPQTETPDEPVKSLTSPSPINAAHPLIDQLKNLGVSAKMAQSLVKKHSETEIQTAIAYTQTQQAAGKVTNVAGFVVEAIKNGYTPPAEKPKPKRERKKAEPAPAPKVDNLQYFADLRKRFGDIVPIPPEYETALKAQGLW